MWCEDEQLGAFLVAANLPRNIVGQSRSHTDDIGDIIRRKFVAPSGQAGRPVEKTVARAVVSDVLKVYGEFGRQLVREWVLIMTKGNGLSRGVL